MASSTYGVAGDYTSVHATKGRTPHVALWRGMKFLRGLTLDSVPATVYRVTVEMRQQCADDTGLRILPPENRETFSCRREGLTVAPQRPLPGLLPHSILDIRRSAQAGRTGVTHEADVGPGWDRSTEHEEALTPGVSRA